MELGEVREHIDRIDDSIMQLISERMVLAMKAKECKARSGASIKDDAREREVIARMARKAVQLGLDAKFVEDIYRLLIEESCRRQG